MSDSKNTLLNAINKIDGIDIKIEKASDKELVDIITFCEGSEYLALPEGNLDLWMSQKVILKAFYMGTRGNKDLKLNNKEWAWLQNNKENIVVDGYEYQVNIKEVIEKLIKKEKNKFNFNELHLIVGRRGSKTLMASIITAYEAYKLLTIGGGDPYKFYGIPYDDEIAIINVATSQKQAGRLFAQVKNRIRNAPFFKGRVVGDGSASEVRLYTDVDLEKLEKKKKGEINLSVPGSIVLVCGHSNPASLRGYAAITILFDELGFYDSDGIVNGEAFYGALRPSIKQFKEDGRLVEISSPGPPSGIFYKIGELSKRFDNILSFQLPTWIVNEDIDFEKDLVLERDLDPDTFAVEYGAQWPTSGTFGNYFPEGLVDRCIRGDIEPHERPQPGFAYYLHVDPAGGGDRYVALLVAKEIYTNHIGKKRPRVRLANMWIWDPVPGMGIRYAEVDKDMIQICAKFHPMVVTYDQWESGHSLQLLKQHGVNTKQNAFNAGYKRKIYQNVKDMMAYEPQPELWLYDDHRLINEIKALRYRPTQRGYTLVKDKHGPVKTDDCVDCLAGAVAMASTNIQQPLPAPVTVWTGAR